MIPKPKPLRHKDLRSRLQRMPAETLADRCRRKIRDEMTRQHLSQRDMAGLTGWSQSRVSKLLNNRVEMGLTDLEGLCFALSLNLCELVRQEGYEYVADLTPTELRVLEAYRQRPQLTREAIAHLLGVRDTAGIAKPPIFRSRKK